VLHQSDWQVFCGDQDSRYRPDGEPLVEDADARTDFLQTRNRMIIHVYLVKRSTERRSATEMTLLSRCPMEG
jgi:hypothetical protein